MTSVLLREQRGLLNTNADDNTESCGFQPIAIVHSLVVVCACIWKALHPRQKLRAFECQMLSAPVPPPVSRRGPKRAPHGRGYGLDEKLLTVFTAIRYQDQTTLAGVL